MNMFNKGNFSKSSVNELMTALMIDNQNEETVYKILVGNHMLPYIPEDSHTLAWMFSQTDKTIGECIEMISKCLDDFERMKQDDKTAYVTEWNGKTVVEFREFTLVISSDDKSKETAKRVFNWCKELEANGISLKEVEKYEI